jgi:hypothetical protein
LLLLCLSVAPARGAVFLLNSTSDFSDFAPGDGSCDTSPIVGVTICTLRAAVQEANALPGDDVIQLLAHTYRLDAAGLDTNAAAGDLDITSTIRIEGGGRGVSVIEQSADDRVFELPFMGDGNLTLVGLTLRGGDAGTNFGGGVLVREGALSLDGVEITGNAARLGAGIFNMGTTQIVDSVIWGNSAEWRGGGISSASLSAGGFPTTTLVVDSSTIGPNTAELLPKELELSNAGSATLTNVTVSHADPLQPTVDINNEDVVFDQVTVRGELTPYSFSGADTLVFSNSAIEYCNLIGSPLPVISRLGVNASANAGCAFAAAGGIEAPLALNPLADNGGPTPTLLPLPGSPLVDAADDVRCAAFDQRGVARPQDGDGIGGARCDIGAVEGAPEPGAVAASLAALVSLRLVRNRRSRRGIATEGRSSAPLSSR